MPQTPEERRKYSAKYYVAHLNERQQWLEDNKEKIQNQSKKYYDEHKEKIREHARVYGRKNYDCDVCGGKFTQWKQLRHELSIKHQLALLEIEIEKEIEK